MNVITARQRSRTYAELARAFSEAEPGLEREYTRLFLGPGRPVASPYESVYREGRTMGETTLGVRRCLVEEGLTPNSQRLPDHVAIELALMAHFATREALAWEAGEEDEALALLQRQGAFLSEHLGTWFSQFCHRILAGRPVTYYAQLAQRAKSFVVSDAAQVQLWLGDRSLSMGSAATDRSWWLVTVGQRCTLCHLCIEMCQPGALAGHRDEDEGLVTLDFDPVECDGCAACERWCPEGAAQVVRVQGGADTGRRELARSALLACPSCGRLHVPQAMISGIVDRLASAQELLAERLLLCYDCRARDDPLRSRGAAQQIVTNLSSEVPLSHRRTR